MRIEIRPAIPMTTTKRMCLICGIAFWPKDNLATVVSVPLPPDVNICDECIAAGTDLFPDILQDRGIRAAVVLIGQGTARRDLEDHAVGLGIAARVRLVGEQDDVQRYLRGFSAFALPSLLEGMPNALQEALAAALPSVASDVGDVRRLLDDGTAGIVVAPRDVRGLADGLQRILSDATFAEQLGARGRARMKDHYSMEAAARQTGILFRRVINSSKTPFTALGGCSNDDLVAYAPPSK